MRVLRTLVEGKPAWAGSTDGGKTYFRLFGSPLEGLELTTQPVTPGALLAPIDPPAIIGIGQNYRRHAEEMGSKIPEHPVVFYKNPASLQHRGAAIELPRALRSDKVDFEAELAVVIGERCKNATLKNAMDFVLGFTCANDVSARDWQKEWGGGQWCKGKSFDTFCPLGPEIVTIAELGSPSGLKIQCRVNGETYQDWTTEDLIFTVEELIVFLSGSMTLLPGTIILTGTPHGVGTARTPPIYLKTGDTVAVEIEGIGILQNPVIEEKQN